MKNEEFFNSKIRLYVAVFLHGVKNRKYKSLKTKYFKIAKIAINFYNIESIELIINHYSLIIKFNYSNSPLLNCLMPLHPIPNHFHL